MNDQQKKELREAANWLRWGNHKERSQDEMLNAMYEAYSRIQAVLGEE